MTKRIILKSLGALAAGWLAIAVPLSAQDGGLLDVLVRKGILTDQEAEDLRAEMSKEMKVVAPNPAVSQLRLSGDLRFRFQYDNDIGEVARGAAITNRDNARERWRYRVRFGADYFLSNNWRAGLRLESGAANDSTNQNFGSFFDKTGDALNIGLVYAQYVANNSWFKTSELDLRFGKHAHPFLFEGINGFVWDSDINPEGLSQQLTWGVLGSTPGDRWSLRTGQYVVADNVNRSGDEDQFLWVGQLEFSRSPEPGRGWKVAPTLLATTSGLVGTSTVAGTPTADGTGPANGSAFESNLDDFAALLVPAEIYWLHRGQPVALYGTYGYNYYGDGRTKRIYGDGRTGGHNQFFNVGLRYGQQRNIGNYQFVAEYRYIESGAFTGNLLDSDFNGGGTNGAGPVLSASYNFTDAIIGQVTWFHSNNIDRDAPVSFRHGPGNGAGQTVGNLHKADVLQLDLSARF